MQQQQPDWAKMTEQLGQAFKQMGRTLAAQGAMGWAYRGDLEQLRSSLATMSPEHVAELSAAAALLTSACDEELQRRGV
ncbi:hypothetical protein ACQP25_17170 [Microtetraspora malaysiensis]|uniref:hypothetical protein n=1 Tax=Microtetraspora malaysiensis TaxID=161358 RepID=UPI003D924996